MHGHVECIPETRERVVSRGSINVCTGKAQNQVKFEKSWFCIGAKSVHLFPSGLFDLLGPMNLVQVIELTTPGQYVLGTSGLIKLNRSGEGRRKSF